MQAPQRGTIVWFFEGKVFHCRNSKHTWRGSSESTRTWDHQHANPERKYGVRGGGGEDPPWQATGYSTIAGSRGLGTRREVSTPLPATRPALEHGQVPPTYSIWGRFVGEGGGQSSSSTTTSPEIRKPSHQDAQVRRSKYNKRLEKQRPEDEADKRSLKSPGELRSTDKVPQGEPCYRTLKTALCKLTNFL